MNRKLMIGDIEEIVIEFDDLIFTDVTLNNFLERVSGRIDYISRAHADAQKYFLKCEQVQEQCYLAAYKKFKDEGNSDKTSETYAKADEKVQAAKSLHIESRHVKDILYAHVQSLNSARECAFQRAWCIRKEMDKLGMEIYSNNNNYNEIVG